MYKVVVIEDEPVIRMGLVHTVDWNAIDCLVAGEADNGEDGLALILKKRPEIVIADICVPKMDGLSMLREASKAYYFSIIILTGYSDFCYAHEAIQLHVADYLLKPINEQKLCLAVEKAKNSHQRAQNARQYELHRMQEKKGIMDVLPDNTMPNFYVDHALRIIHSRYNTQLSLHGVAEELGVSESYLARKFREITGLTFLDCLNQYRINKALQYIRTGGYRIGEISDLVGFTQYKQFAVVFRKYVGMSCSEFLRRGAVQKTDDT